MDQTLVFWLGGTHLCWLSISLRPEYYLNCSSSNERPSFSVNPQLLLTLGGNVNNFLDLEVESVLLFLPCSKMSLQTCESEGRVSQAEVRERTGTVLASGEIFSLAPAVEAIFLPLCGYLHSGQRHLGCQYPFLLFWTVFSSSTQTLLFLDLDSGRLKNISLGGWSAVGVPV